MAEVKVELHQVSPFTSEASIRTHRVLIDRPAAKGGADQGPMGGELFLAAVGGCLMSNLLAAIRARETAISDVRMEITGSLVDAPARFTAIEICITANTPHQEALEHLVEIADRGCIMMNTLRGTLELKIRVGAAV